MLTFDTDIFFKDKNCSAKWNFLNWKCNQILDPYMMCWIMFLWNISQNELKYRSFALFKVAWKYCTLTKMSNLVDIYGPNKLSHWGFFLWRMFTYGMWYCNVSQLIAKAAKELMSHLIFTFFFLDFWPPCESWI